MPKKPEKKRLHSSNGCVESERVIYKPIEPIETQKDFPEKRWGGFEPAEGWRLFSQRQSEINLWGNRLSVYMKNKKKKNSIKQHEKVSNNQLLKYLSGKDTVYVHSHGNSGMLGLTPYNLSALKLAKRLKADGLSQENTPRIKLWACYSGEPMPWNPSSSFAKEVGKCLKDLGYNHFSIFGYRGKVLALRNTRQPHKEVQDSKDESIRERAKDRRNEYKF